MDEYANFLKSAFGLSSGLGDTIAFASLAVGIVAALFGIFQILIGIGQWRESRIASRRDVRRAMASTYSKTMGSYTKDNLTHVARTYVEPELSSVDPNGGESHRQVMSTGENAFKAISKFLRTPNKETNHLLLLADSGMGKSSLLLALYLKAAKGGGKFAGLRVAVIPCGLPNVADKITAIEDKHETVLCLDGFDEDTEAVNDHQTRLAFLLKSASEFAATIVSCRTQFFRSEEEIPRRTGVAIIRPRGAGEGGEYLLSKIYITPFDDERIKSYVKKNVPLLHRKRALEVIRAVPDLAVRPMLLATIPSLARLDPEYANVRTKFDLYGRMIDGWLEREKSWIEPAVLRAFSEEIARDLFVYREARGAELMPRAEFDLFCKSYAPSVANWKLSGRSLLVRNADGAMKFAHRSIMEFMAVCSSLRVDGDGQAMYPDIWSCKWTDVMEGFMSDLFNTIKRGTGSLTPHQLSIAGLSPCSTMVEKGWDYWKASNLCQSQLVRGKKSTSVVDVEDSDALRAYYTTLHFGDGITIVCQPEGGNDPFYAPFVGSEGATVWIIFAPLGRSKDDLRSYFVRRVLSGMYLNSIATAIRDYGAKRGRNSHLPVLTIETPAPKDLTRLRTILKSKPALVSPMPVGATTRAGRAINDITELGINLMTAESPIAFRVAHSADGSFNFETSIRQAPIFPNDAVPIFAVKLPHGKLDAREFSTWAASNIRRPNREWRQLFPNIFPGPSHDSSTMNF